MNRVAEMRLALPEDTKGAKNYKADDSGSHKKDSVLNRKLKSMIKKSKHLNDFNVSSFAGNEREGSLDGSDMDAIERSITQHNALRLQ